MVFGFVGGDKSRQFNAMPADQRKAAIVSQFTQFFGAGAANPIDYIESYWAGERWSRGCPVGIAGPGVYTGYGTALRQPVGRIHWAGTETSDLLERLHGRRGSLRRARGGGGARKVGADEGRG